MQIAFILITFLLSCKIFSKYFYLKLRTTLVSTYVVPRRFYFYFLFLITLSSYVISTLFLKEEVHILTSFTLIYSLLSAFFFLKGFKTLKSFVIKIIEYFVNLNFFLFSIISVLTIILIFYSIITNSLTFFNEVGIFNFLFKANWQPENYEIDPANSFGILPLIVNTLYITLFAVFVAFAFGVLIAIYLSEYIKTKKTRFFLKSYFEIVAGIPSIFYGFFGAFILAPNLVRFAASFGIDVSLESILVPGIAIGIMMIPYVSTLLDDAFSSIPKTLKDAAIAMGLTRFEMVKTLVLPIALPEIISTLIIVISRVLGETMIVLLTCGIASLMTLNPFLPSTTITVQIVHLLTGDTSFDSLKTLSVFGLSLFLFVSTMILNIISIKIKNHSLV